MTVITIQTQNTTNMQLPKDRNIDILFFTILVGLSIIVHFGRIGYSIDGIDLSTDACNYSSMAAAMEHPDTFAKDPVYDDKDDYSIHATITTPLVSKLAGGENFGLSYIKLTSLQFFLHHLTFYILGIALLKQRWQAVVFSVVMSQIMWVEWGTFWGNGHMDHLPRSNFSTLYALFVAAALHILRKPKYWPIFMFAIGCTIHIHAISTLPTAMGFWLGFAICKPKDKSWTKHGLWLIFSGCFFLIPMIPFALKFLRPSLALTAEDVELLREILRIRYNIGYTEHWAALQRFLFGFPRVVLLSLGVAGFFVLRRFGNEEDRERATQFALWAVGMGICLVLFLLDKEIADATGKHASLSNIIRSLRFSIFFSMCLSLMAFNTLWRIVPKDNLWAKRGTAFAWFALMVGLYAGGQQDILRNSVLYFWNSLDEKRYEQAYSSNLQRKIMLEALQAHTEKDALIYHNTGDRAIRYKALRPLVYHWRDPSIYYFAKDMQGLRFWYDTQKRMAASPTAYMELAMESNADYIVSTRVQDKEALQKLGPIVWENQYYILIKINR